MNINMLADKKKDDYCGVFINEKSEERSVAVAVIICKRNMYPQKPQFGIKSDVKQSRVNLTLGSDVVEASF